MHHGPVLSQGSGKGASCIKLTTTLFATCTFTDEVIPNVIAEAPILDSQGEPKMDTFFCLRASDPCQNRQRPKGAKIVFRHRESNPGLLGESQLS